MRYLLRPFSLWARYWPQLAACYLLGMLGRTGAIELAAWIGHDNDWWPSLIMPLAALARAGSFAAMLLVLRPAIPILEAFPRRSVGQLDIFSTVIAPFFAIYIAWQLIREDWLEFETRALDYRIGEAMAATAPTELHPDTLPVSGTTTWAVIASALVVRFVLSKLKDRLPTWMVAVRVYVDALWVFIGFSFALNQGLTVLLKPGVWLSERRIVAWFNMTRADLFSHFQPLEAIWDTVMWALRTVFGGATVPLLWLAIAGIVYGVTVTTSWRSVVNRLAGDPGVALIERTTPARKQLQTRWGRVPKALREKSGKHAAAKLGNFGTIANSARLILHGGVVALALYVLAYLVLAWLDMSGGFYRTQLGSGYLFRGMAWSLGPHSWEFWSGVRGPLTLISHLIIEPLRICLVASTFAYCLQHAAASVQPAVPAPEEPAARAVTES